jgi:hypothetical protein
MALARAGFREPSIVVQRTPRPATLSVTRKQLTLDHEYQKVFNKAFDAPTRATCCSAR